MPAWKAIECNHSALSWICNESSKSENQQHTNIAIHSSGDFARENASIEPEKTKKELLNQAAEAIKEPWLAKPQNSKLHYWKYYRAIQPVDDYYLELEMKEAPLAVIGNYFKGNSLEAAYISAVKLAAYWIDKYAETVVEGSSS
jgi:predicted NAD/FAD-dependent oxidoreductase